jgi:hypothetical protein
MLTRSLFYPNIILDRSFEYEEENQPLIMPRDNIPASTAKKLTQFFTKTLGKYDDDDELSMNTYRSLLLDTNNDGLVNWTDFEAAIEVKSLCNRLNMINEMTRVFLFFSSSQLSRKMKQLKMLD